MINLEDEKFSEKEVFLDAFVKFKYEQEFLKNANQIFKLKGKFGVINYKNIIVIPCKYQLIENIHDSNEFIVKKNNKYGVVNSENKIIENIDYDQFNILKESILFTKTNKRIKKYYEISYK
ncbi:WG repeat-containing protein [Flavobacterium psychrophilum]|nr:WG repeat-containing protein [Flavobacterium psychrophilum]